MMPVEKLRLRPWLESALNSGHIPGVKWIDSREKIFQVSWKHASRQGWKLETDACIFKEWAIHTGRYRQLYDKPDPRRWKANFRCALNALPDIKELQARGVSRGNDAYKVYQMLRKPSDYPKDKEKMKNAIKDVASKVNQSSKIIPRYNKATATSTAQVIKRHSVIHKSSTVIQHSDSSRAVCTSHPVNPQSLFYWPTCYSPYAHPHMKDHDYLTTWFDPRPEMKDIGVMTYQDIKKEPDSPHDQSTCCQQYDEDAVVSLTDVHYINNVKQEKTIPSDEEIIDLVDSMSRNSDTASNGSCGSTSSFDEYADPDVIDQESAKKSTRSASTRPAALVLLKQEMTSDDDYKMTYGYQDNPPPPLTPESASEILKGITSPVNQTA